MKRLVVIALLLVAGCAGVSQDWSLPDGCRYPGSSAECRGLHTG